jgi:hypothetical protein
MPALSIPVARPFEIIGGYQTLSLAALSRRAQRHAACGAMLTDGALLARNTVLAFIKASAGPSEDRREDD